MPASLVVSYLVSTGAIVAGGLAAAAITFGIRLVTTLVISSIIAKRAAPQDVGGQGQQQIGNRIQLPPATDNKIGVVYGSAFMKPILVDAKISTDQKTMWHVMVFSEAMDTDSIGTFSFGDIYWGDKKLNFDGTDRTKVISWTNSDGTTEDQPNGLMNVYLYRDGSFRPTNTAATAIEVLSDSEIAEANRWDSTKLMSKLVFAIVKIKYDQEKGITGLADITAQITNTLTKPGAVIKDYLSNVRYGAGLPLGKIDTTALTALDNYSDDLISYTPAGGGSAETMSRYRINGPVDTTKNFLDNLVDLCESCDSWLQWNEVTNKWSVIINRSYLDLDPDSSDLRQIDSSNIIGGVNLNPIDLNSTFNEVEVQFPNTKIKDQPGYHIVGLTEFPNVRRSPNEPDNKLTIALPYCNNIVQAQYIAARRLLQSREDLVINFTMDYSGIQIDAGDVIGIHHEQYGWGRYSITDSQPFGKLFRVHQVQEGKDEDGSLYAQITASEYNDGVYDDDSIDLQDFTPEPNTGIPDPTIINPAQTPSITNIIEQAAVPEFTVQTVTAGTGNTVAIEFWYSTVESLSDNTYTLYRTELPNAGNAFGQAETVSTVITGLPAGTYYWRVRAVGLRRKSTFSAATSIVWGPSFLSEVTGQNFQVTFQPAQLAVPRTGTLLTPTLGNITPKAFGTEGGAVIPFVLAQTDSDPLFTSSTWRIGSSSSTGFASITQTGITFSTATITTSTDKSANFAQPLSMASSPAFLTIPVRYKDAAGVVYQSAAAAQQYTFQDPGAQGQAGFNGYTVTYPRIWFLAPTNAYDTNVTGGVYDRLGQYWVTRPTASYSLPGNTSSYITVDNYDYAIGVTTGNYRWTAQADQDFSNTNTGTFTATWTNEAQIEAGFGPAGSDGVNPQFIDFDIAGGTVFYRNYLNEFTPARITATVIATNIDTPAALWTVNGGTYVATTTNFVNDTITITPNTGTALVTASVSVDALTKTLILPVVERGEQGPIGPEGPPGVASTGTRGFVPLAYIPITVNPNTASQAQLTTAWTNYTGLAPIFNDGGSFYFGSISKSFSYNSLGQWVAATLQIAGDLIADGTIRANALAANEVFTNKFASTNAAFGLTTSTGYWLDGSTGNARFGGNVSIGSNLTVAGLITSSQLTADVVDTDNIIVNAVSQGTGASSNTLQTYNGPSFNTWYGAVPGSSYVISVSITTSLPNQLVYAFGAMNAFVEYDTISTPTWTPDLQFRLMRYNNTTTVATQINTVTWRIPNVPSATTQVGTFQVWPGVADLVADPGTYTYYIQVAVANGGGTWTPKNLNVEFRSVLVQELKR